MIFSCYFQDKDSEVQYLRAAVQQLQFQVEIIVTTKRPLPWLWSYYKVEDFERVHSQLEDRDGKASQMKVAELEGTLKKKEKEIKRMKSAEKAMVRIVLPIILFITIHTASVYYMFVA